MDKVLLRIVSMLLFLDIGILVFSALVHPCHRGIVPARHRVTKTCILTTARQTSLHLSHGTTPYPVPHGRRGIPSLCLTCIPHRGGIGLRMLMTRWGWREGLMWISSAMKENEEKLMTYQPEWSPSGNIGHRGS
ncbi:hypothetical protein HD554DRAFT_1840147 [Boletus coccyginus]|nr:hypothetical protein HD554DRAFT_1840147 [Boletus coccyginus]